MKGLLVKNNDKGKSRFIIFLNRKPFDSPKVRVFVFIITSHNQT